MKIISTSVALTTLLATSIFASANNKYEITPHVGNNWNQNNIFKNKYEQSYGISFGKRVFDNTIFEFDYERMESGKYDVGSDGTSRSRYSINAILENSDYKVIIPYIFAGVGYEYVGNRQNGIESGKIANIGVGLRYVLDDNFHLKLSAKEVLNENSRADFVATLGFSVPFGLHKEPKKAPVVIDEMPPPPPSLPPMPPKVVELDSDGDGVLDSLDLCPNTPQNVKVDKDGCPIRYNLLVNFEFDSDKIRSEFVDEIEKFAEFLKAQDMFIANIEGHTCSIGSYNYNQKLSEKRAKSVVDYLIKLGISEDRLSFKGFGESNPIADNESEEGRVQNRRVEAGIEKR